VYANVPYSKTAYNYAVVITNPMLIVNSSVNVVIYCFMGRQFRVILFRTIGRGDQPEETQLIKGILWSHCTIYRLHYPPEQSQSG